MFDLSNKVEIFLAKASFSNIDLVMLTTRKNLVIKFKLFILFTEYFFHYISKNMYFEVFFIFLQNLHD